MLPVDGAASVFLALGLATLAAAVLPRLLHRAPISMPTVFLGMGALGFWLLPQLPDPSPIEHPEIALHLTEVCVIVSLMGAGLAINRPFAWRTWGTTWRLLGITMPLSMVAVGVLGWAALGLGAASAILLAAALAPTDPVLATEVQVSEPVDEPGTQDDEARFALTSEAGLNDGLAFPFTYAAIAVSIAGLAPGGWLGRWVLVDVVWRLGVGVAVGYVVGWLLGRLFFSSLAERLRMTEHTQGFVALAATFLAYGVAEVAEGYGFVAVFVCAVALRGTEREHQYHKVLHGFVEQIERLLTVAVIVLLGGALVRGVFPAFGWAEVGLVLVFLLVVRPVTGFVALRGGRTGPRERAVVAFFGVRGVGSLFYIAYAAQEGGFADADRLWGIVALVVVGSVLIHGASATPVMRALDRRRDRRARVVGENPAETPV
ncbi:cation:proton antiporter [Cellulomonas fimi]|uniref:Sodium/hydrogen exchanger n=1 Tax=Cellulomonas fimi (strain ATCC 484 / DSM 20113 / JCM 1341 / CCUG 24087 / LMG 16345 / NBRC 15513 / NCIMB 8980 / NCTC 7547 / NRS-133) TaxID=590998 RepID=F4H3Y5_CELFA|nr:cation:proton antiporter [Cellulomonas fimi]AEE44209.1 sodium/hydrogen exchanger [Cellulomonas fimi ATCC 484]NNH05657.1 sodium:proton antiporter [Cellulomonas fimi]VEH25887.1 potassium/proton antiporter [Cellulomonas fimi]